MFVFTQPFSFWNQTALWVKREFMGSKGVRACGTRGYSGPIEFEEETDHTVRKDEPDGKEARGGDPSVQ